MPQKQNISDKILHVHLKEGFLPIIVKFCEALWDPSG